MWGSVPVGKGSDLRPKWLQHAIAAHIGNLLAREQHPLFLLLVAHFVRVIIFFAFSDSPGGLSLTSRAAEDDCALSAPTLLKVCQFTFVITMQIQTSTASF